MPRHVITTGLASAVALASLLACANGNSETTPADTSAVATAANAASAQPDCVVRGTLDEARARPSPLGELRFTLGGEEALICYSRPSVRGRVMIGGNEPYGRPWRLGANEATVIHLPFAADIGGVAVEPGSYSLYAILGEREWEIVVNSQAERWGIPIDEAVRANDVGSFKRPVTRPEQPVEQMEFTWEPQGDDAGNLVMQWENSRVEIPIRRTGS